MTKNTLQLFLLLNHQYDVFDRHHRCCRYVTAFGELAKSSTTMLLPGNPSDVGSAVAQAMAIYGKVTVIKIHLISDLLILTTISDFDSVLVIY